MGWKRWRKCLKAKQDAVVYSDKKECLDELKLLEKQGHIDLFYGDESGLTPIWTVSYWFNAGDGLLLAI